MEYLEDVIENDPQEAFPPAMDGDLVVFRGTGDEVIDAWEAAIAKGKTPDLAADLTAAFADDPAVMKWLTKKKPVVKPEEMPEDFHDDFTKGEP